MKEEKKYNIIIKGVSVIINLITFSFLFGSLFFFIISYNMNKQLKEKEDPTKIPFDILNITDFNRESYFIDLKLLKTINDGKESLEEISKIKNEGTNYKKLEELNRKRFILISGKPGTGKSFTSQAIIGTFPSNYKIINITPSTLESQFVGESAKYLASIFKYIKKHRIENNLEFIIYFDECDSLIESNNSQNGGSSLINQFLLAAGGDDTIKRLPFICIFITNIDVNEMFERCHRRFTHISPDLMNPTSLNILFENFCENHLIFKNVSEILKQKFITCFTNKPLQHPIDTLIKTSKMKDPLKEFELEIIKEIDLANKK